MWILDLDGVIWLQDEAISGSPEAVRVIRESGMPIRFVTNNSLLTKAEYLAKFQSFGMEVEREEIISSSDAAASLLKPGERVYVFGGDGLREAVEARGGEIVDSSDVDVVIVGWAPNLSLPPLTRAMRAIRGGARFIATNSDATYPTPKGLLPGAGSMVAAVATAAGKDPVVAGKPNETMAGLIVDQLNGGSVMVGDRLSTDGRFAKALGVPFYLVLSGITSKAPIDYDPMPSAIASNLYELVEQVLGGQGLA